MVKRGLMSDTHPIGNFEYVRPGALDEALNLLNNSHEQINPMAGGTDLILQMKQNLHAPSVVLDVKQIPELNRLEWKEEEGLHIGAAVPISKLLAYAPVAEKFNTLSQACALIGSMQIKNRGSIGGNICNAAPSADSPPALLSLDAKAQVASVSGTRQVKLAEFFIGPGKTCLKADELLVEIIVPNPPDHSAGCYLRHTTREEMDIAAAGVAAFLVCFPDSRKVKKIRIALGAVAPTPIRALNAEALLTGKSISAKTIEEAALTAAEEANPISDLRASAEYRRELIRVLTRRALSASCKTVGIKP